MRRRPVYLMGKRNWRWLWLRRKRRLVSLGVYSDPKDKERRS